MVCVDGGRNGEMRLSVLAGAAVFAGGNQVFMDFPLGHGAKLDHISMEGSAHHMIDVAHG